jgi:hypothetical protein
VPTLLYGLTLPDDPRPSGVAGAGGGECRVLEADAVAAIVETVARAPEADVTAARAHDAVLGQFVKAGATVAAVRFGQAFDDDATCIVEVNAHAARVASLLREHQGCVEMRVLLPVEAAPPSPPPQKNAGPGRAYLDALRASGQVAPDIALRPIIGPTIRAERVEGFQARAGGVRGIAFAHLVHRDELADYRDALHAVPSLADARVVGPLPLYSFSEPAP